MFITTTFTGMDTFAKALDHLKSKNEQHLHGDQVSENLRDDLERLGNAGEETYIYRTFTHEFHFTMTAQSDITLSIQYTGFTENS